MVVRDDEGVALETLIAIGAGILLGLSIAAPPGPMNALIATNTVRRSRLAGHLTGFGAMTSDGIFLAVTLAVGGVIPVSPGVRILLYLAGAIVMFFLAVKTYPALRGDLTIRKDASDQRMHSYVQGLLLGLTNPFQILWWLTAGLAFMRGIGPAVAVGFFLGILTWILLFPATIDLANRRWRGTYRVVLLLSLLVLVAFGTFLAVSAVLVP